MVELKFNISASTEYEYCKFIEQIRNHLCVIGANDIYETRHGRRILGRRPNLFEIAFHLTYYRHGQKVQNLLTLICRERDLYIIGYRNSRNTFRCRGERQLGNVPQLPFGGSYIDLARCGKSLSGVRVGKYMLEGALMTLCEDDRSVRYRAGAFATVVVNIAESLRYKDITRFVLGNYVGPGPVITDWIVTLVKNWKRISAALFAHEIEEDYHLDGMGMTLQDAHFCISVLLDCRR